MQEALSNVREHGDAARAIVSIELDPSSVIVTVRDDGSGFEPSAPAGGFGPSVCASGRRP